LMKKLIVYMTACLLMSINAHAAMINNGNFQTCDLSGWQKDTDGLGDVGASADFSVVDNAGACSAQIYVDDLDTSTAFFANTLFTDLDLSATDGQTLTLSFDWLFEGTDGDALFGDYFSVFLGDGSGDSFDASGNLGFLVDSTSEYGSGMFSIELDASLYNQTGWTLEFQLFDALSPTSDILFSSLQIDNVQLIANAVNTPASSLMFMFALAFVCLRNTRN